VDSIRCPTLLVRGEHSPVLAPAAARQLADRIGQSELVVIGDGAHDLGVEQPEAVAAEVLRFLRGAPASPFRCAG
jgi:pimeloyl-ACP methyl ester carboxylesterase